MTPKEPPTDYVAHGEFTDPEEYRALFGVLPKDVAALCRTIQGLLIHDDAGLRWYGDPPAGFHAAARDTLPVSRRLRAIMTVRDEEITHARPPFERAVGTCRDFSLMLCAMLRQHGIPARVRCGFGRYFDPSSFEDHWVCEYWQADNQHWAIADAQLDERHRTNLSIAFDPTDVPADQFVFPWQAWRSYRSDETDPALFGHGDHAGPWFIQVNLARDVLSLCNREVSAWDSWRDAEKQVGDLFDDADWACDRIATLAEAATGLTPPQLSDARIRDYLSVPPWNR